VSDDIESRLRLARSELPRPNRETEKRALTAALAELPERPAAKDAERGSLRDVLGDAFGPRRRQVAVLAAAVLPSIALGAVVGVLLWPGPSGAAAGSSYPGPTFTPAEGWTTVTTSASDVEAGWAPLAWASNVPLRSSPGPFGIFASGGAELIDLPADGVVVVAWLAAPELVPAPENPRDARYRALELPLELSDAEVRPFWEGQPAPDIPEYAIWARVNEQWVDVRVYFGSLTPSEQVLAEANEQLARLRIPDPSVGGS
jgi:hypothetical protein